MTVVQGLRNAKTRSRQSQPAAWMNNLDAGPIRVLRWVVNVEYSASEWEEENRRIIGYHRIEGERNDA
jgi:hypothetical protein